MVSVNGIVKYPIKIKIPKSYWTTSYKGKKNVTVK